jgi:tetratricopeptide (TPR) repeat protein
MQHLLQDIDDFDQNVRLLRAWSHDEVIDYVERRKAVADAHWNSNPETSLEYANEIIGIGCLLGETGILALGLMARGDAVKLKGRHEEAWDTLGLAGDYYHTIGDEIGWGRTRIGRLSVCMNVNRIDEALTDAQIARDIFERCGESIRVLRLEMNVAYFHMQVGNYQQALSGYTKALETAFSLKELGIEYVGILHTNLGYTYAQLGNLRQANEFHQLAYNDYVERDETLRIAMAKSNLAYIAMLQGRYRDALNWLHSTGSLSNGDFPVEYITARRLLIQCYLFLNRYQEARRYALEILEQCRTMKMMIETGFILLYLATAEAELGNEVAAITAINDADSIFTHMGSQSWASNARLKRAQLAFKMGNWDISNAQTIDVIEYFLTSQEQINLASATLLRGQIASAQKNWGMASQTALDSLRIAWKTHTPWLRYSSQLLLGQVAEAQDQTQTAIRRYRAAAGTIERLQRELTITLRPGFLGSKEEALHRLIGLHLSNKSNDPAAAWEALERAKSQTLLNHLMNREKLRWTGNNSRTEALVQQLEQLRQDYAAYDRTAHESPLSGEMIMRGLAGNELRQALLDCENKIRSVTEQLYLISGNNSMRELKTPSVANIQPLLGADHIMVEFYIQDQHLWVFTIDQNDIKAFPLQTTVNELGRAIREFEFDREVALVICADHGFLSTEAREHGAIIRDDLKHLYHLLVEPIAEVIDGKKRVTIVPYGLLHYLPFHLLYTGHHYWIEQSEIVVVPAAGLMLAESPRRLSGALILSDDWNGRLPQTLAEGQMIAEMLKGNLYVNEQTERRLLAAEPRQILHIAAHGKYRMDQPDMSYIHLHDGQLLSDDLFQNNLSYELVTLSACETGRAKAVSGDELIGLGRGFLYAGAGALIASLWRIEDQLTLRLMNKLYAGLRKKDVSKAAALQRAQLEILEETPDLHPLLWGAFQLIGNASPLSQ